MTPGADARAVRSRQAAAPAQTGLQLEVIPLVRDYISLTKPRIISLLLLTTVTTMFVADPSGPALSTILWTMLGGYLAAGGAGAINHYIDRNRDAKNNRTKNRPLADGRIKPINGLIFGITLGAIAFFQLWFTVNFLSAALAMVGLFGYVFLYTLWLKPLTPQNIVIGGSAGAVPPLVGWAAASGGLTLDAMWPFMIIFFWTPPHFWALSLMIKDDYAKTGVPMLPVVKGEAATRQSILIYTIFMVGFTVGPYCTGLLGPLYLAASVALGLVYIGFSFALWRRPGPKITLQAYLYSLAYLALLFIAMAVTAVAQA
ncbi:MAG: Protoheme farnesyltransferase [Actinomycetota bacterium]|jgi:protoheme IX farnesyltransferase|nr:Protoheme farnesyltransferase [Actinomycetota bacterium]